MHFRHSTLMKKLFDASGGKKDLMATLQKNLKGAHMTFSSQLCPHCRFSRDVSGFGHVASIIEEVISTALDLVPAEACLAYLPDGGGLRFAGLRRTERPDRLHYYADADGARHVCPLAEWTAKHREIVNLSDLADVARYYDSDSAYHVTDLVPDLNRATDLKASSTLILPLRDTENELLAIIQMVNRTNTYGETAYFSGEDQNSMESFAAAASQAISGAQFMRSVMSGLIESVALRDPAETNTHADRVGAISAEIYHHMAEERGIKPQIVRKHKDQIRIAAMLHDVGKIGIPGHILQKPGRLTPEERAVMEHHCAVGAKIFSCGRREMDKTVRDVALYHHQRWDGRGYTGDEHIPNLRGEGIPLAARIVAVADVYDALVSRRCYKEPWEHDAAVAAIRVEVGTHFDPEVVAAFSSGENIIKAIQKFYVDQLPSGLVD